MGNRDIKKDEKKKKSTTKTVAAPIIKTIVPQPEMVKKVKKEK